MPDFPLFTSMLSMQKFSSSNFGTTLRNEPRVLCDYPKIIAVDLKHLPNLFSVKESETNISNMTEAESVHHKMGNDKNTFTSYYLILSP